MIGLSFKKQPFRTVYLLYQAALTVLVLLPFWTLASLPRSWRPRRSWDLRRCLNVKMYKRLRVDINGIWVDPIPSAMLLEPVASWARISHVEPVRIPGYWYYKPGSQLPVGGPPAPGERVIYALHGGAYVLLSAYPSDPTANIARGLLGACGPVRRVFSLEYRLSMDALGQPAAPFPAALLDAISGYRYLVDVVGFAPADIVLEGDSAGGNLALALTRYLVEHAGALGSLTPPGALLLNSPWSDASVSHMRTPSSSAWRHQHSDYLSIFGDDSAARARDAFLGPHGPLAESSAYVSPASLDIGGNDAWFKGFPRTFVCGGGAEMLLDQIHTLVERMSKDIDTGTGKGQVVYYEAQDGVHDFLIFMWHEPERSETLANIAKWIEAGCRLTPDVWRRTSRSLL